MSLPDARYRDPVSTDSLRASRVQRWSRRVDLAIDNVMTVEFFPSQDIVLMPDQYLVIEQVSFTAVTFRNITALEPLSGLFLCPLDTPLETSGQMQFSWSQNARPHLLPLSGGVKVNTSAGGALWFVSMAFDPAKRLPLARGWSIRAILAAQSGAAPAGPGVGSTGVLSIYGSIEG